MESKAVSENIVDMKFDGGKLLAAIPFQDFPDAMQELVKVCTMGANKYERHSWKNVDNLEVRYNDARCRHFLSSFSEERDQESGYLHLIHEAWNCLALAQTKLEKT